MSANKIDFELMQFMFECVFFFFSKKLVVKFSTELLVQGESYL